MSVDETMNRLNKELDEDAPSNLNVPEAVPAESRYPENKAMKVEIRRERHFWLWLQGKKLRQIEEITGFERTTIWKDLNWMRAELVKTPRTNEQIRQEALMSLRIIRSTALSMANDAKPAQAYKYLEVAARIEELILTRYTQPSKGSEVQGIDQARDLVDYLLEKFGPDEVDRFVEWVNRKHATKKILSAKESAEEVP